MTTHLLVDGENIDGTIGNLLGRKPGPDDRPRWERVIQFAAQLHDEPANPLFFLNVSSGVLPMPFLQALVALGFRPIPLSGPSEVKVVDVAIQRTLEAIGERDGNVVLASHDVDFKPQVEALLAAGRGVTMVGFREFMSSAYASLAGAGLQVFDLELDVSAFLHPLPRLRVIEISEFDPTSFL